MTKFTTNPTDDDAASRTLCERCNGREATRTIVAQNQAGYLELCAHCCEFLTDD